VFVCVCGLCVCVFVCVCRWVCVFMFINTSASVWSYLTQQWKARTTLSRYNRTE